MVELLLLLGSELVTKGVTNITTPSTAPDCLALGFTDSINFVNIAGTPRFNCLYSPLSSAAQLPLVVWFHPGGDGLAAISSTHLLQKAASYSLSSGLAGFHVIGVEGRYLHYPTTAPRDGHHHDFYHRNYATNPDVLNADAVIDALCDRGVVKTDQIYLMGWSNGGFFAQFCGIPRSMAPTPGGRYVASIAVFATADPFNNISWDPFVDSSYSGNPTCTLASPPTSKVPILLIARSCDAAVACGSSDFACYPLEPGYQTTVWLNRASTLGLNISSVVLGGFEYFASGGMDLELSQCTSYGPLFPCSATSVCSPPPATSACVCTSNHLLWPDGAYSFSTNVDWEPY